ncbi:hypothetical protein PILCRDRAFT_249622 [Piloderma croceum F 1598]|uniref:F-box domain-containing protein n=1 Tax=Piloderma croceum (strain F 1598) TaxID=765440 RepID=A0A0C3CEL7_PILCF|nr:hypothetical protein PILCRDRAFT_249622 [Piloderma croceum F 1598]
MTSISLLLGLPGEVLLAIASFSDVPAILSLRKTCTLLNQLSHDITLWLTIISRQKYDLNLPLPRYTHELSSLLEIPTSKLEEVAVSAYNVHRRWLVPRSLATTPKLNPKPGLFLLSLEIFLERWLLCVYCEGNISLWDIGTPSSTGRNEEGRSPGSFCVRHQRSTARGLNAWSSCAAAVDVSEQAIVLACMTVSEPTVEIYRIALPDHSSQPSTAAPRIAIETVVEITIINLTHLVRAIYPTFNLIAFSRDCLIDIFNWETKESVTITTGKEDLDELWNGIVALRFFPPYILCVGTRTVELHEIPQVILSPEHQNPTSADLPTFYHHFPEITIRSVSISSIHPSYPSSSIISILAYDVLHGLFHYNIHLPTLNVQLLGTYSLGTPQNHTVLPGSTRSFVSSCCLGEQGKRGVWIERGRGSTKRSIFVFEVGRQDGEMNRDRPEETTGVSVYEDREPGGKVGMRLEESTLTNGQPNTHTATIDGKIVYEIGSYDLREDLTHCAFSEVSGRIVLGNRAGEVMVL